MDTKTLREEFAKIQHDAQAILSAAAKEARDITKEEQEANDKRFARMDQIRTQIQEQAKFAGLALDNGNVTLPKEPEGRKEFDAAEGRQAFSDGKGGFNIDAYKKALNTFARTGETRQLFAVTSTTQSGAFLPKEVLQPVQVRRLSNAWRNALAAGGFEPMEMDSTASFSLPVADDTAYLGQVVTENATSGTEQDPDNTASITINPTLYGSKQFWYSNTMVMAQAFDVVGYTLPMAQKRIEKSQESAWTTTAIAGGTVGVTTASPTAITYAELLNWEHALLPAYRTDACFVVSDSLYRAVRGLVDSNNRPVMDEDPTNVFGGKIHGKPVIVSDYFQTLAAGNHICGAFVSSSAIKIVDVKDARLARYAYYPAKPDQIGFEMFQNGDCGFVYKGMSLLRSAIS